MAYLYPFLVLVLRWTGQILWEILCLLWLILRTTFYYIYFRPARRWQVPLFGVILIRLLATVFLCYGGFKIFQFFDPYATPPGGYRSALLEPLDIDEPFVDHEDLPPPPPPVLPDYIPMAEYDGYIREAAAQYGVSVELIYAIMEVESNFNPQAVSRTGALGLMQLIPENVKLLKVKDPFDPAENIDAGVRYLAYLKKRLGNNQTLVIAAYNAGPGAVEKARGIPRIRETENYVVRVRQALRNGPAWEP